ncbi:uncharacterized protein LOC127751819 isoform X1 [Frankliniella occidentalis]|uniref:Uncharacterized protein LOC127751819 isoform X1 n=1 Tax=Frankliniella occidentalis TaxID=133901 RepID=A0A9C6X9W7_FRAOC|nr:uncharacterized protein LOC127751819 isoform X1 [Frankliniella occidentalis]
MRPERQGDYVAGQSVVADYLQSIVRDVFGSTLERRVLLNLNVRLDSRSFEQGVNRVPRGDAGPGGRGHGAGRRHRVRQGVEKALHLHHLVPRRAGDPQPPGHREGGFAGAGRRGRCPRGGCDTGVSTGGEEAAIKT